MTYPKLKQQHIEFAIEYKKICLLFLSEPYKYDEIVMIENILQYYKHVCNRVDIGTHAGGFLIMLKCLLFWMT